MSEEVEASLSGQTKELEAQGTVAEAIEEVKKEMQGVYIDLKQVGNDCHDFFENMRREREERQARLKEKSKEYDAENEKNRQ